jgi:hypothetical protein
MFDGKAGCLERRRAIKIHDATLFHDGYGAQGFVFAPLLAHPLEDFEKGQGRYDQGSRSINRLRKR